MIKRSNKVKGNFTPLDNRILESGLTVEAQYLLWWLLAKPPTWQYHPDATARMIDKPVKWIRKACSELEANGHVFRSKYRVGSAWKWDTKVYECPDDNPHWTGRNETENSSRSERNGSGESVENMPIDKDVDTKTLAIQENTESNSDKQDQNRNGDGEAIYEPLEVRGTATPLNSARELLESLSSEDADFRGLLAHFDSDRTSFQTPKEQSTCMESLESFLRHLNIRGDGLPFWIERSDVILASDKWAELCRLLERHAL